MRFQKGEFCKNWDFQCVNFWMKCGFLPQCERDISKQVEGNLQLKGKWNFNSEKN